MKRVKLMLSAILVMAVVAAGLAFKVKAPLACAYSTTNPAHANTCPRISVNCTPSETVEGDIFATTLPCPPSNICPPTTVCDPDLTLQGD